MKMAKVNFKTIKKCEKCANDCKQEVEEKQWETAEVIVCGKGKKFKKK